MEIEKVLQHLTLNKFVAIFEAGKNGLYLPPFKGSTFRGSFGHIFREVACTCSNKKDNHEDNCPYAYIFETSPVGSSEFWSRQENVPRPFLFEPTLDQSTFYAPGERFQLGFTLFGNAKRYLPFFIYALDRMGKKGLGKNNFQANLKQIFSVNVDGNLQGPVFEETDRKIKDNFIIEITGKDILKNNNYICTQKNKLTIYFVSPTRLQFKGQLIDEPSFSIIMSGLIRRISSLLYFHCNVGDVDWDELSYFDYYKDKIALISSDVSWIDVERYSNRQKQRMKMGGIVGKCTYEGDFSEYIPWLHLSQWVNIGKNPVFGLGKIKVVM